MWHHLVLTSLLTAGMQAYAPIGWAKFPTKGLVIAPVGSSSGFLTPPQRLTIKDRFGEVSPSMIHFTGNPDGTITWDYMGWCVEADGRSGHFVRMNYCTGEPNQRWAWLADGHGRTKIRLRGTSDCLSVISTGGLNEAGIGLGKCGDEVTDSWLFGGRTLDLPKNSSQRFASNNFRHALTFCGLLALLGALSFTAHLYRRQAAPLVAVSDAAKPCNMEDRGESLAIQLALHQSSLSDTLSGNAPSRIPAIMALRARPVAWTGTSGPAALARRKRSSQHPAMMSAEAVTDRKSATESQLSAHADGDTTVEFPEAAGPVERAQRALSLWGQVSPVLLSYLRVYSGFQIQEKLFGKCLDEEECEAIWDDEHDAGSTAVAQAFNDLKGFYVKVGQIIATRQDLFPQQYSDALAGLTDFVDPMDASLVHAVISQELLNDDETFDGMFAEFDDKPLGAASVAQVHRARLTEAYGGCEVAIKVQRPSIEAKLLGDIAVLKGLAKVVRGLDALPVDYYKVFTELEDQLAQEFDFVQEAAAMQRIGDALATDPDGTPCSPAIVTPRPVAGLVTKRVLVMDYLKGVPLSRSVEVMRERGIDPDSPEAQLFGRRLLSALTEAFGRTILETGFFHADPHPGNIFVLDDGRIGLIDFGQVKQVSPRVGITLAKVMIALSERTSDTDPDQLGEISRLALELGVKLIDNAEKEGPAAVAMWLFDGTVEVLPGGFDTAELSPNSPVKVLKDFPQELTLVGRSTILIKGIASRLGVRWNLAKEWEPIARRLLDNRAGKRLEPGAPPRFRDVMRLFRQWSSGKVQSLAMRLPGPVRRRLAAIALRTDERRASRY